MGNEIRAAQAEFPSFRRQPLSDSRGYTQEPFLFYFPEGPNTIRLEARQESIFIAELIVDQIEPPAPYAEVKAGWPEVYPQDVFIKVQGKMPCTAPIPPSLPSAIWEIPQWSPITQPRSASTHRRLALQPAGQWIAGNSKSPRGAYTIAFKAKQNLRVIASNRRV